VYDATRTAARVSSRAAAGRDQEAAIEFLLELLAQLVLEIVGQVLFELAVAFGWESLKDSARRGRESTPVLAATGHLLLGLIAGVLSLFIVPHRLAPRSPLPGLSLVLSPIGTGIAMHWIGEFWREHDRPVLFSFRAGATVAFGMALVRFVHVGLGWRLF
jgi:hypothetical protein